MTTSPIRSRTRAATMPAPDPSSPCGNGNDEALLVRRLRSRDPQAAERLVREYGPRMMAVARRLLRCEQDSADAVQEAFICALRHLDSFGGDSRLSTWLHRIVVNAALMKLRSRSRKSEPIPESMLPSFDETGHYARPVQRWVASPEQELSSAETRQVVRACIDQLPESYRTVLLLRDIEELDTNTVAQQLGCTVANVKTRLHRARQSLRALLEPIYAQPTHAA